MAKELRTHVCECKTECLSRNHSKQISLQLVGSIPQDVSELDPLRSEVAHQGNSKESVLGSRQEGWLSRIHPETGQELKDKLKACYG